MSRFFLDTEFIESGPGKSIQLISIGLVCEDGREFYAISSEFDPATASDWVKENVLAKLEPDVERLTLNQIAYVLIAYIWPNYLDTKPKPEFWGYFSDYDWVCFCQCFGTMMDLPKGFPMFCLDIKQLCVSKGDPRLPEQGKGEHNSLADAKWNKLAWEFLQSIEVSQ